MGMIDPSVHHAVSMYRVTTIVRDVIIVYVNPVTPLKLPNPNPTPNPNPAHARPHAAAPNPDPKP